MAETDALIPYPSNREIVLRARDAVVVFNPASKQLVVRSQSVSRLTECPYCHRPLQPPGSPVSSMAHDDHVSAPAAFGSPEYFRMLLRSLPATTAASLTAGSEREHSSEENLNNNAESIQTSAASGRASRPPPGAEFIASSPATEGRSQGISSSAFSPGYLQQFFIEERELGRGGKGVVLLVRHVLDGVSLGHFALKRIPVGDDHDWLKKVLVEVQLLQHLSHQNLVSYRHVWLEDVQITSFGPSVPCAFVLQQYCNAGDLHHYILVHPDRTNESKPELRNRLRRLSKSDRPPPDLPQARKLQFEEIHAFFRDIVTGLNHLHVNGYIHRDLKPQNCLLHDTGQGLRVLVSDFGEVQSATQVRNSTGATGTISYCAPEVLRQDPRTGELGNFTTKSDIFSLGMILFFLCFARLPYNHADQVNEENEDIDLLREEIAAWPGLANERSLRPDLPEKLYRFLRRLLSLNPNERPGAEEILQAVRAGAGLDEARSPILDNNQGLRPGPSRFQDLPAHGSSTGSTRATSPTTGFVRSEAPSPAPQSNRSTNKRDRKKPSPLQANAVIHSDTSSAGTADSEINDAVAAQDVDEDTRMNSLARNDARAGSLVLRTKRHSPVQVVHTRRVLAHGPWWKRWPARLGHADAAQAIQTAIFLGKTMSLYISCVPLAANPAVALPLMGLAALDLLLVSRYSVRTITMLLVVHIAALVYFKRQRSFCLRSTYSWSDVKELENES